MLRFIPVLFLISASLVTHPSFARNILSEQNAAAAARDAHHDAETRLQDIQKRIANQQAVIKREQERLNQYQEEEAQARKDIIRTQQEYEQKSKALEEAWKKRNDY